MTQLNNKKGKRTIPSGKPVKPIKPKPSQEESAKVLAPVALTEERVREIAREEILRHAREKALFILSWPRTNNGDNT